MAIRKRILILPIAAVVIGALVVYKQTRTYPDYSDLLEVSAAVQSVPRELLFAAYDTGNRLVKVERYVGRHRIVLVFFDAARGADGDPLMLFLRENFDGMERSGTVVVGVSTALPQQNRAAFGRLGRKIAEETGQTAGAKDEQARSRFYEELGRYPFALVTDVDGSIHRAWGLFDEQEGTPLSGLFVIDRAGRVAWDTDLNVPKPAIDAERAVRAIVDGAQ